MGQKVYVVVETWDNNNDNVRAVFSTEAKAQDYVHSKQGDWDYYELCLDVEKPDDSIRLWSVEIRTKIPEMPDQHDINWFKPRKDAFYVEYDESDKYFIIFVEANRENIAFKEAINIYNKILKDPDKYKGCNNMHKVFYCGYSDLYDINTGEILEKWDRDEKGGV